MGSILRKRTVGTFCLAVKM